MRICLISREYPPDTGWGGVGAYTYQTAIALSQLGHEIEVVALAAEGSPCNSKSSVEGGISVHRVAWQKAMDELNLLLISAPSSHYVMKSGIAIWRKFLELHRKKPFDIVEAPEHLAAGFFHAITKIAPLALTLHTPHSKFVSENFHGIQASFDNQLICLLERMAILQADALLAPSIDLASFVADDTGIDLSDAQIVRNPVDTNTFAPHGIKAIEGNENVKIGFVGRLEERKGIQYIAEAIPDVLRSFDKAEFIIVGNDTNTAPGGTSMKSHLENKLRASGASNKVTFVSHVPLSKMPSYYRSFDISVIPSLYDNAPYTCIEAISSGNPVIVSDLGGTKEYVTNGKTGTVIPGKDSAALARAIIELAKNDVLRQQMGNAAREYALQNLDSKPYAEHKVACYKETIAAFNDSRRGNIYKKPPEKSLQDAVELLCAFDHMMFETLSNQSLGFKLRHWGRLFRQRPKLALSKFFVSSCKKTLKNFKVDWLNKLEVQVNEKEPAPYEITRTWAQLHLEAELESVNNHTFVKKPVASSTNK